MCSSALTPAWCRARYICTLFSVDTPSSAAWRRSRGTFPSTCGCQASIILDGQVGRIDDTAKSGRQLLRRPNIERLSSPDRKKSRTSVRCARRLIDGGVADLCEKTKGRPRGSWPPLWVPGSVSRRSRSRKRPLAISTTYSNSLTGSRSSRMYMGRPLGWGMVIDGSMPIAR